jgi:hypothetical protein
MKGYLALPRTDLWHFLSSLSSHSSFAYTSNRSIVLVSVTEGVSISMYNFTISR